MRLGKWAGHDGGLTAGIGTESGTMIDYVSGSTYQIV